MNLTSNKAAPLLEETGFNRCKRCRYGIMLFDPNDLHVGHSLDLYGQWAQQEIALLLSVLRPGDRALDLGANIGTHTLAFATTVGETGEVISFEPQRIPFQSLCANLALNGLQNVDAKRAAVGADSGVIRVPELSPGTRHNVGGVKVGGTEGAQVPVIALDELELESVRLIKIDIEGMELEALRGGDRLIRRCRPVLYVENNQAERSNALIEHLLQLDYSLYWHFSPFFDPENYFGKAEDLFGGMVDANMLCLPSPVPGLPAVEGADDTAEKAFARRV